MVTEAMFKRQMQWSVEYASSFVFAIKHGVELVATGGAPNSIRAKLALLGIPPVLEAIDAMDRSPAMHYRSA